MVADSRQMACPACGAPVPGRANFCVRCGHDLRADRDSTQGAPPREDAQGQGHAAHPPGEPGGPDASGGEPARAPPGDRAAGARETVALVDCRRCSAPNSTRRDRCGRCGADLATGRPDADVPGRVAAVTSPTSARTHRTGSRRGVGTLVIVAGLAVGALIGVAVALRVGPLAPTADAPPVPRFDPAVYTDRARVLPVAGVETAPATDGTAGALVDGDPATAWRSTAPGPGAVLEVRLAEPAWVTALEVANGDQGDERRYRSHARARAVRIELAGGVVVHARLLDGAGGQRLTLPEAVLTGALRLTVLEVFPGDDGSGLALSELSAVGHVAVGADRELAGRLAPPGADPDDR